MSEGHFNEPRNVSYTKGTKELYENWTKKEKNSGIFAGINQSGLFFFAMAIGVHRNQSKPLKKRIPNMNVSALSEDQKWGILSASISKNKDLLVLKNEKPIYETAEEYAEEGMKIIKSHIDKHGLNYPKFLETELRDILKGK